MSSSPRREALTEPLPCPECGETKLIRTVANCRLADGVAVKRLRHYKCLACGARLYDDAAIHRIQAERAARSVA